MLNCLASNSHRLREAIQARLHRFENCLVLPARNASLCTRRAFLFYRAVLAARIPVPMQGQVSLFGGHAPDQTLTRRAAILIGLCVVNEIVLAESSLCRGAGCHGQIGRAS